MANTILRETANQFGKAARAFTDEALACMQAYHWPGNVRELQNQIKHMLVMGDGEVLGAELLAARIVMAVPGGEE